VQWLLGVHGPFLDVLRTTSVFLFHAESNMAPKKAAAPKEEVSLGPQVREGELVFG